MCLLSEIGKNSTWVKPERMLVIQRKNVSYNSFWNESKHKWGGLLDATIYSDDTTLPTFQDVEYSVVDYRELTNIK